MLEVLGCKFRNASDLCAALGFSHPIGRSVLIKSYGGTYENLVRIRLRAIDNEDAARKLKKLYDKLNGQAPDEYSRSALEMAAANYIRGCARLKNEQTEKLMQSVLLTAGTEVSEQQVREQVSEMLKKI